MDCEKFDEVIELAFNNYGPLSVNVQLLSVTDKKTPTPPGDWYSVTLEVEPVVSEPHPRADTWYYGGLMICRTEPAPLGIRPIEKDQLIGCSEAVKKLPSNFPLDKASVELSWVLSPSVDEPLYHFHYSNKSHSVGAYSGEVKN
ncbi:MAG: hypothetical protein SW833_12050 [Cyanobacteriota bacterium]|nr:hypothetical protein [Cyanobacteriota bacterium]